jgi:hypothetical protein
MEEMPGMPTGIRFPGGGTRRGQLREGDSGAAGARKPRPRLVAKLTTSRRASPTRVNCRRCPPRRRRIGVNHGKANTRHTRTYDTAPGCRYGRRRIKSQESFHKNPGTGRRVEDGRSVRYPATRRRRRRLLLPESPSRKGAVPGLGKEKAARTKSGGGEEGGNWKSDVSSGSHPRAADTEGQFRPPSQARTNQRDRGKQPTAHNSRRPNQQETRTGTGGREVGGRRRARARTLLLGGAAAAVGAAGAAGWEQKAPSSPPLVDAPEPL